MMYAMFSKYLCFPLVTSLFKMAPKHSVEVLFIVLSLRKVVMCPRVKINVLDKFHLGMIYNGIGYKFNVNELIIYIK